MGKNARFNIAGVAATTAKLVMKSAIECGVLKNENCMCSKSLSFSCCEKLKNHARERKMDNDDKENSFGDEKIRSRYVNIAYNKLERFFMEIL